MYALYSSDDESTESSESKVSPSSVSSASSTRVSSRPTPVKIDEKTVLEPLTYPSGVIPHVTWRSYATRMIQYIRRYTLMVLCALIDEYRATKHLTASEWMKEIESCANDALLSHETCQSFQVHIRIHLVLLMC
jgi:hypothetical protein